MYSRCRNRRPEGVDKQYEARRLWKQITLHLTTLWHGLDSPYAWNCTEGQLGLGLRPRGRACSITPKLGLDILLTPNSSLASPSSHHYCSPLLQRVNFFPAASQKYPKCILLTPTATQPLFRRSRLSVLSPELRARPQPSHWRHRGSGQSRPCRNGHLLLPVPKAIIMGRLRNNRQPVQLLGRRL
ncbi:uncharacterized protein P174DRAFT_55485 [Aspergillus novofumigatus IBT 16806]|uniref:Uncharacterized protein n=1 Tax=Aspergillus novofumigatus (strain IBT 16806) TaxID=1392255 RepID=A0A2I1BV46_ASPN1|nr:uncharacterized protein P174DRAFT_55485 [Aspergillus novofumigatus IBT 16806]PKX89263.1 hypothetical protein P174DRAFT_55485 [Aspergillus novofumigatus IBT 16806]